MCWPAPLRDRTFVLRLARRHSSLWVKLRSRGSLEPRLMTIRLTSMSGFRCLPPLLTGAGRVIATVLMVMAIAITSTGWSTAAGLSAAVGTTSASEDNHHAAGAHDHGTGKQAIDTAACKSGEQGCRDSHHQPQDLVQSCCAMACHTAILSIACVAPVSLVTWQIKHRLLADVLESATLIRLDRPPQLARV